MELSGALDVDAQGDRLVAVWGDGTVLVEQAGREVARWRERPGEWVVELGAGGRLVGLTEPWRGRLVVRSADTGRRLWRDRERAVLAVAEDAPAWLVAGEESVVRWSGGDRRWLAAGEGELHTVGQRGGTAWFPAEGGLGLVRDDGSFFLERRVVPTGWPRAVWPFGEGLLVETGDGLLRVDPSGGSAVPWSLPGWRPGLPVVPLDGERVAHGVDGAPRALVVRDGDGRGLGTIAVGGSVERGVVVGERLAVVGWPSGWVELTVDPAFGGVPPLTAASVDGGWALLWSDGRVTAPAAALRTVPLDRPERVVAAGPWLAWLGGGGQVSRMRAPDGEVHREHLPGARSLAVAADGAVAVDAGDRVLAFGPDGAKVLEVPSLPARALAVAPGGGRVLVADGSEVRCLGPGGEAWRVPFPHLPLAMGFAGDGAVLAGPGLVARVDAAGAAVLRTADPPSPWEAAAIDGEDVVALRLDGGVDRWSPSGVAPLAPPGDGSRGGAWVVAAGDEVLVADPEGVWLVRDGQRTPWSRAAD